MEEMSVFVPGFKVQFEFELTNDDLKMSKSLGIPERVLDSRKFRIYNMPSFGKVLERWVDYPLPLVFIDKFIVDEEILMDNLQRSYTREDSLECIWSGRPLGYGRQVLEVLHNEGKIFQVYSAEELLKKGRVEFQRLLFSVTTNEEIATRVKNTVNRLNRSYDEMVVPSWLFESFCLATAIFIQRTISGSGASVPLLTDDSDKELFFALLPYTYSDTFIKQFKSQNERLLREFTEFLPAVSSRLSRLPFSASYKDPREMAYKILELRDKAETKEARRQLFNIYKRIKEYKKEEEEIVGESAKEIRKAERKLSLLNIKIPFEIVSATAEGATGLIGNWRLGIFMLPFIVTRTYLSVKDDVNRKEEIKWVGLFQKFM